MSDTSKFGTRMSEKMAERGISQADLCRLTGFASSMVSHYCTNRRVPSVPVAVKIARVLNTTVEYLAFGTNLQLKNGYISAYEAAEESSQEPYDQKAREEALLQLFQSLNAIGKEKVMEYIRDLLASGRFKMRERL